jgi:cell division protein FtsB/predicted metal-dependent hydrolase
MKNKIKNLVVAVVMGGLILPGSMLAQVQSTLNNTSLDQLRAEYKQVQAEYQRLTTEVAGLTAEWKALHGGGKATSTATSTLADAKSALNEAIKNQLLALIELSEISLKIARLTVSGLTEVKMGAIDYASSSADVNEAIEQLGYLKDRVEGSGTVAQLRELRSEFIWLRNTVVWRVGGFAKIDAMADKINRADYIIGAIIRPGMYNNDIQSEELSALLDQSDALLQQEVDIYTQAIDKFRSLGSISDPKEALVIAKAGNALYGVLVRNVKATMPLVRQALALYRQLLAEKGQNTKPAIISFSVIVTSTSTPVRAAAYWESKNTNYCDFAEKMGYSAKDLPTFGFHGFEPETSGTVSFRIDCFRVKGAGPIESATKTVSVYVPGPTTTINVDLVKAEAVVTRGGGLVSDSGMFTVTVDVTSEENPVFILKDFVYSVNGDGLTRNVLAVTSSTFSPSDSPSGFFLERGATRRFSMNVHVVPIEKDGFYSVALTGVPWEWTKGGESEVPTGIAGIPGDAYETPNLYLDYVPERG